MKSKDVFAVVETLYVMARGGVLCTPGNSYICVRERGGILGTPGNIYKYVSKYVMVPSNI